MHCPTCNSEIAANAKFCIECGVSLSHRCPKCSYDNSRNAKFCIECGAALTSQTPLFSETDEAGGSQRFAKNSPEKSDTLVGERRHLTVMFCDLADSTEISTRLDPEEWHEMVREYLRESSQIVERFGGHVAKFLGDGLLVHFGWPHAHDNDPERGIRAGLALVDSVAALSVKLRQRGRPELLVRVGIHTGPAVIGEGGKDTPDIFGETPNIAARVQAVAKVGTVVITAATRRLVSGQFLLEDLGATPLKGIAQPIELCRAIRPVGSSDRLSRSARSLPLFVGRNDELRMLINRFERARDREGQTVLILGEAGIGKTRLLQEFRERIAGERHTWIDTAADALSASSPFHPLRQAIDNALRWRGDETDAEKIGMLEGSMTTAGLVLDQAYPLVARMLDLPVPEKYPTVLLSPEQERERLLVTLAAWTLGSARAQPMIVVLEDLHWADPSTLAWVRMLAEQCATAPLLVVATARPEFEPAWPPRAHHLQLTLGRLSNGEVRQIIEGIAAKTALKGPVVDTIAHRASGVPLFAEELTRLVVEEGVRSASRDIPVTLSGSLLARLDQLGEAKVLAETAAVMGHDFEYRMLREVTGWPDERLKKGLRTLADADLIYQRGAPPEAIYRFKHALVRDAAYEVLLRSRRRELHAVIAATIQESAASSANLRPELVAYHLGEAGEQEQASEFWRRAGESSAARGAFLESEEHFNRAIATLALLPQSGKHAANEMQLLLALGQVMAASRGYSSPETAATYARARMLGESLERELSPGVLIGQWAVTLTRGDITGARELASRILERSSDEGRRGVQSWAHYIQGQTCFFCGDLHEAEAHLMRSVELYEGGRPSAFPQNPRIESLAVAGAAAWLLGRPGTALDRVTRAWQEAHELNLPFDVAFVGPWICSILMWRGEFQRMLATSREMLDVSTEHHFPQFVALARMYRGSALCALGNPSEGVFLVRQGLDGNFALGRRLALPELLTWLAEAQFRAGNLNDCVSTLEDALNAAPAELYWRPETLRLRGELALIRAESGMDRGGEIARRLSAERDFLAARSLAAKIGARSLELRAASSLARQALMRGERQKVQALLGPVLDGFSEGHETQDLREARELIAQSENGNS